jgi:quinol monooxygenase YgiN
MHVATSKPFAEIVPNGQLPFGAVVLTATVKAFAGQEAVVRSALLDMVAPSRGEPGCICYNLHEANDEPGHFVFYEQWTDQAAFDTHCETPHFLALDAKIDGRTETPVLAFQTLLG